MPKTARQQGSVEARGVTYHSGVWANSVKSEFGVFLS